ncbi:MAG: MBL fold metallo-hydrolase [Actinomycetota bacterium]|nr:MBL fold metallo-hydrolase [Actinomycetota bacterium]
MLETILPIETFSLPTPYAVGPVNAYAIIDDPITVIDAGVNTVDSENALKLGFAAKGLFLESVQRILITHAHPDHYGLVPTIMKMSGAIAYMGEEEIARIFDNRTKWELGRLLTEAGFPPELLQEMAERDRQLSKVHQVTQLVCEPIKDGDIFEFRDFMLVAVALPGHTGGHLGFFEPATGTMFAGDTLLPHVSPNPLLEPILEPETDLPAQRRRSLKQYLESLDKLESLDLKMVYPGHGPVITDPNSVIHYMREHHTRRLDVVFDRLTHDGKTAYEVSQELYPNVNGYDHFLALSEVVGHLDVLVEQARALPETREDGVEYFARN